MSRPITTKQYERAKALPHQPIWYVAMKAGLSETSIRRIRGGMFKLDRRGIVRRKVRTHLVREDGKRESYSTK